MYKADKNRDKAMQQYNKMMSTEKGGQQPPPVVLGPTADGAFGQYMLGQLDSLAKFSKVNEPLHNQFINKQGKDGKKGKGNEAGANVRIVDAAGMAADGEEGDGMIQGMFDNQPFTDDQIKEAFFTFDMNGNGYIGVAEIRFVLDALGEDVTDEEIDEMVRMLDVDGDG